MAVLAVVVMGTQLPTGHAPHRHLPHRAGHDPRRGLPVRIDLPAQRQACAWVSTASWSSPSTQSASPDWQGSADGSAAPAVATGLSQCCTVGVPWCMSSRGASVLPCSSLAILPGGTSHSSKQFSIEMEIVMTEAEDMGVDAREERERLAAADADSADPEDGETGGPGPVDRPAAGRTGKDVTGVNPSAGGTMEPGA